MGEFVICGRNGARSVMMEEDIWYCRWGFDTSGCRRPHFHLILATS